MNQTLETIQKSSFKYYPAMSGGTAVNHDNLSEFPPPGQDWKPGLLNMKQKS
jgi:hypothetical protein